MPILYIIIGIIVFKIIKKVINKTTNNDKLKITQLQRIKTIKSLVINNDASILLCRFMKFPDEKNIRQIIKNSVNCCTIQIKVLNIAERNIDNLNKLIEMNRRELEMKTTQIAKQERKNIELNSKLICV